MGSDVRRVLIVAAILDFAQIVPLKNDSFLINDCQLAGNETWVAIFLLGDLPFADAGLDIRPPGNVAGRDIFVTSQFDRERVIAFLHDADNFVEMAGIMPNPFAA